MSVLEKPPPEVEDHGDHDHHHVKEPFWKRYIFSQDHKVIGLQYAFTAMFFLMFGFCLMILMRWQLQLRHM